ncbi:hypothetical protein [Candidatus Lariskella endosymbiont of Epinotia ramella]|uniref:phage terminase large subunit family protein n=1 Tax=Candidatus Lariskella endosymbiont of Epinotia ramella TaxID=3066224 RepID=UPI0030D59455
MREKAAHWFENTLYSRLNDKRSGAILVVTQRLHTKDLCSFLLNRYSNWTHLKIPFIAEETSLINFGEFQHYRKKGDILYPIRDDHSTVDEMRKGAGLYAFSAQYQQEPINFSNSIIKPNWIIRYKTPVEHHMIYQSWDFAIKSGESNDYSVCTTWSILNDCYYLIDVLRIKVEYQSAKIIFIDHYKRFNPEVALVEDKASGQQIIQEFKNSAFNIIPIEPKYDKVLRLQLISSFFESGRIFFLKMQNG